MKRKWKRTALMLAAALTITSLPAAADKEVKAEGYDVSNPVVTSTLSTWDTLTFGNYWQEDTNGDGVADQNDDKQPIQWRVLSVNGNDAFLMAEKTLDNTSMNIRNPVREEEKNFGRLGKPVHSAPGSMIRF